MIRTVLSLAVLVAVLPCAAVSQEATPTTTNPAERVVYRGDRSDADQRSAQLTCYQWASGETSWDPEEAYAELEEDHSDALAQYNSTRGAAVGGAARGALAGLAIGAIAGDAGTGAAIGAVAGGGGAGLRGRRSRMNAEASFEEAANDFIGAFRTWDRHWTACMIGNGYGVG